MTDPFSDPSPWREPSGLQHGRCADCGAVAGVDAAYAGTVRCGGCWAALRRPPAAGSRWVHGSLIPPVVRGQPQPAIRPAFPPGLAVKPPAPALFRVIVPTSADLAAGRRVIDAEADMVPAAAGRLAEAARAAGRTVRLSYALAEDLVKAELVHSIVVRVRDGDQPYGYAGYRNGQSSGATLFRQQEAGFRACGVTEFAALAGGRPYAPPAPRPPAPQGPCPACGKLVRWKLTGSAGPEPYKHKCASTT